MNKNKGKERKLLPPTLMCDFYKLSHREQYPTGTESIYSTLVPRSTKYFPHGEEIVVFGIQYLVKRYVIDYFDQHFFGKDFKEIKEEYERVIKYALGNPEPYTTHLEELHNLGYMPVHIKALDEGTIVKEKTPIMTIENTDKRFFWVTNFLETIISAITWRAMTSATISREYRKVLDSYALKTVGNTDFVGIQGHDFSMRGQDSLEGAELSGMGHLLSFIGTDTVPAILAHENYYNANIEEEVVGVGISATEHSVMSANGNYDTMDEYDTFKRLITEVYPTGYVSIVSDTWDFWRNIEDTLPRLKREILSREGRVVIRPDTGDPVKVICGDSEADNESERKGLIECLWDIFGGTYSEQGYKVLNDKIGAIYGDSITIERAKEICKRLEEKGFATTNIVLGIGSYTFMYNTTRDTLGFAIKATHSIINGEEKLIYKDPKTGDGVKKSNRGRVVVLEEGNDLICKDGLTIVEQEKYTEDKLTDVFKDGELIKDMSLSDIRKKLKR